MRPWTVGIGGQGTCEEVGQMGRGRGAVGTPMRMEDRWMQAKAKQRQMEKGGGGKVEERSVKVESATGKSDGTGRPLVRTSDKQGC